MDNRRRAGFDDYLRARMMALLRMAYLLTGDRHAAEDLLQDVLERMYVHWPRIAGDPHAYARRALVNRSTNRWRLRGRRPEATLAHHDVAERDHSADVAVRDTVVRAIRDLPPKQRAAVVLRYLEDLPVAEVARTLGCSEGTVKSNTARGLDRLRAALSTDADRVTTGGGHP
jgi:RNA polymerase sigma-70 factor (sigma-E family)